MGAFFSVPRQSQTCCKTVTESHGSLGDVDQSSTLYEGAIMRKSVLNSVNKVCLIVFLITGFTLPLGTTAVVAPTDAYADF